MMKFSTRWSNKRYFIFKGSYNFDAIKFLIFAHNLHIPLSIFFFFAEILILFLSFDCQKYIVIACSSF